MKRGSPPDRWLSGRTWEDDPAPKRVEVYNHNGNERREVSYSSGRAFLRETARHEPDNTITPDEQKVLHQHQLADAETRQARSSANFARALELGAALKVLRGEE